MYTLELTEKELVYLKLLVGKQTGKDKTELYKDSNEILNKLDIGLVISYLFFSNFNENEKQIIKHLSESYSYKEDKGDLFSKILQLSYSNQA